MYKKTQLCLIDWKTSERKKKTLAATYENPVQIAAYVGALNHDPLYDIEVVRGCIVIVHNDGSEAKVLPMSDTKLKEYWKIWKGKLKMYRIMMDYEE